MNALKNILNSPKSTLAGLVIAMIQAAALYLAQNGAGHSLLMTLSPVILPAIAGAVMPDVGGAPEINIQAELNRLMLSAIQQHLIDPKEVSNETQVATIADGGPAAADLPAASTKP